MVDTAAIGLSALLLLLRSGVTNLLPNLAKIPVNQTWQ